MNTLYNKGEKLHRFGYWEKYKRGEKEMQLKSYLKHSGDEILLIEESMSGDGDGDTVVNKVLTKFGNIMYWDVETGRILAADWVVPNTNRVDKLGEDELSQIAGEYYLKSYGEKFNV